MDELNKYDRILILISKIMLRFLMGVLIFCLILASIDLVKTIVMDLFSPPVMLIEVETLFSTFESILIITIGYELFKALHIVVVSKAIPTLPIVQIAIIAVANKVITLDIKIVDSKIMFGLATLLLALGLTHFFLNPKWNGEKKVQE